MNSTTELQDYDVSDRMVNEYGSIKARSRQDMKNRHQYLLAVIELANNKYPELHYLDAFCKYENIKKSELVDLINFNTSVIASF
jgi:hypothetical protein